jgi:hypothetical protein
MARKATVTATRGAPRKKAVQSSAAVDADDDWEADAADSLEFENERWLTAAAKEKERSRIQRQMKARRELERRREEKRLRELVADWPFDE